MVEQHDPLVRVLDPLGVRAGRDAEHQAGLAARHLGLEAAAVVAAVGVHLGQVLDGLVELLGGAGHGAQDVAAGESDRGQAESGDDHGAGHGGRQGGARRRSRAARGLAGHAAETGG